MFKSANDGRFLEINGLEVKLKKKKDILKDIKQNKKIRRRMGKKGSHILFESIIHSKIHV